jgi:prepilin-type N-terminal cleavage/methylation domain-containing protein
MKKSKNKTGFTLIELMVTVVASAIVILTAATVLIMGFQSWRINKAYVEMRRNTALAVYLMARDIRESNITNVTIAAGQLQLAPHPPVRNSTVTYTKTGSTLSSTDFGVIIPRGLRTFNAEVNVPGDGVYLTIGMTNSVSGIAMTNRVFVNTRN